MENRIKTDRLIIHHSASDPHTTMEQIRQWHIDKGYETIGYHYVIEYDGTVKVGRPDWAVGAHAYGANFDSLGICLTGNFELAPPTDAQLQSLAELIRTERKVYGNLPYIGHKDVDPKNHPTACPGKLFPWVKLNSLIGKEAEVVTTDKALEILKAKGVISDIEYWSKVVECVKYMDKLVINAAEKLEG